MTLERAGKRLLRIDDKAVMNGFCLAYALAYAHKLDELITIDRLFADKEHDETRKCLSPIGRHVITVLGGQFPHLIPSDMVGASVDEILALRAAVWEMLNMFVTLEELDREDRGPDR